VDSGLPPARLRGVPGRAEARTSVSPRRSACSVTVGRPECLTGLVGSAVSLRGNAVNAGSVHGLRASGALKDAPRAGNVSVGSLVPPGEAVIVDGMKDGDPVIFDGPFTQAQQHMGGFWVVETSGPEHAEELATRASKSCGTRVELRPFQA
jgi:hypothetical protein